MVGAVELLLAMIPTFHELRFANGLATAMVLVYCVITGALCITAGDSLSDSGFLVINIPSSWCYLSDCVTFKFPVNSKTGTICCIFLDCADLESYLRLLTAPGFKCMWLLSILIRILSLAIMLAR